MKPSVAPPPDQGEIRLPPEGSPPEGLILPSVPCFLKSISLNCA